VSIIPSLATEGEWVIVTLLRILVKRQIDEPGRVVVYLLRGSLEVASVIR
jgi:hypothetical protein